MNYAMQAEYRGKMLLYHLLSLLTYRSEVGMGIAVNARGKMRAQLRYAPCILIFVLPISACSTAQITSSASATSHATHKHAPRYEAGGVVSALYQQLSEWKGVRYRYGGLDKSGVDCSGFVYLTLKRHFGLEAPRSTEGLSEYGVAVSRSELQAGDLVFFKTGLSKRHVGIYVEDGKFLHASTSRRVMLSDMENGYWTRRFWKARRVPSISAGILEYAEINEAQR